MDGAPPFSSLLLSLGKTLSIPLFPGTPFARDLSSIPSRSTFDFLMFARRNRVDGISARLVPTASYFWVDERVEDLKIGHQSAKRNSRMSDRDRLWAVDRPRGLLRMYCETSKTGAKQKAFLGAEQTRYFGVTKRLARSARFGAALKTVIE